MGFRSVRVLLIALLAAALPCAADELPVDDFEGDALAGWQVSGSPEYYKGGFGKKGLSIVQDAEAGSRVLRAEIRFADPANSEPLFITKGYPEGPAIRSLARLRFRYKLTTTRLDPDRPFAVRLRTSPTTFTDYAVAKQVELAADRWQTADLDIARPKRLVNIYNTLFMEGAAARLTELTFRLDDQDDANTEGALLVDDIRFVLKPAEEASYTPQVTPRAAGKLRRALVVRQSAAGYYGIEKALRGLPEPPAVETRLFRGLHFPVFDFPASRQALFEYDLVALADVDPYVLTLDQAHWLCDYVASGGSLLFFDGPNTLGSAKRFPLCLADLLPVTFHPDTPMQTMDGAVAPAADHPVLLGLPGEWGSIGGGHALLPRPGATVLLRAGSETPGDWGVYSGGTRGDVTLESDAGHSGARSASLVLRHFYVDPKSGKPAWIQGALLAAPSDGYSGAHAPAAKPSTRYRFSFWVRGDVPSATPVVCAWKTDEAQSGDREYITPSLAAVRPEAQWKHYEGEFTTTAATKRLALQFRVSGSPSVLQLGQRLCVDDVEVAEAREGTPNLAANPGAEETTAVPVLTAGTYQRGRVLVVGGSPGDAAAVKGSFFTGDRYDDLMRQAALWLAAVPQPVRFTAYAPPPAEVSRGGSTAISGSLEQDGRPAAALRCRVTHVETGRVTLDKTQPLPDSGRGFAFALPAGGAAGADGTYAFTVDAVGTGGRVLARRDGTFRVCGPVPGEIAFAYGKTAFAPGRPLAFTVRLGEAGKPLPEGLRLRARVRDFRGAVMHAFPERPGEAAVDYRLATPEWESGAYRVEVDVLDQAAKSLLCLRAPCCVVDPLDWSRFFPVISIVGTNGGGQTLDEASVLARVDGLIAHGFNTVATMGSRACAGPSLSHASRVKNAAEAYAQSRGMGVIFEYESYQRVGREGPTKPCVFSPEYPAALADYLRSLTAVATAVPRLLSIKITDEPFAGPANMDYCEHCRRVFKERYGFELRPPDQIPKDAVAERLAFTRFVSDHVSEGYRQSYAYKQASGGPFRLLLTYCAPGYGYGVPSKSIEDPLAWSRYADLIDFDVYPYFYPTSDRVRMVQVHYCFALHRAIARHLGKPMGFYVELDDRNYPFQINPVEASGECAYTALAQGADYLNSFIHTAFGTGTGARPERWAHLGRELRKVQVAAPLLKATSRPAAPVAIYFPRAQWLSGTRNYAPAYAYQLLLRAFGEADVVDEEMVREKGLGPVRALFLLGTEVLPDEIAEKLAAFVRDGGVLACDRIPEHNERGEPCRLPRELFPDALPAETAAPGAFARKTYGSGQVWLFTRPLEEAFRLAVEAPDAKTSQALLDAAGSGLRGAGFRARIRAEDPEFEAGLRLGREAALLVLVNHRAEPARTRVTLGHLGFTPAYAADAATGKGVALKPLGKQEWSLDVALPARGGQLVAVWPARPAGVRIKAPAAARRGAELAYRVEVLDAAGKPAKGGHALSVSVLDPEGRERPRYGGMAATSAGAYTMRARLATNAAPGRWRIRVRETASGKSAEAAFIVR